jgi:hypothetical protein
MLKYMNFSYQIIDAAQLFLSRPRMRGCIMDEMRFLNCAPKVGHDNIQYERIKVSN